MKFEITVPIRATPAAVWPLLIDVEPWPELTPSMDDVRRLDSGPFRVGSEAAIKQPRLPGMRWRVTAMDPGRSFTWVVKSPGLATAATHTIVETEDGTALTLGIEQTGFLAGVARVLYGGLTRRYVQQEADGFRREAEAAMR
jgi:carbon monoxide dehydrogenase subunit G